MHDAHHGVAFVVAGKPVITNGEGRHGRGNVSRCTGAILRMSDLQRALVVSTGKNAAWVVLDHEAEPRIAQLRRMTGKRFMPVPGDVVHVHVLEDDKTVVDHIEPRSYTLERRTLEGRSKTMAANVDTLVTVTALADPSPRLVTLDQLLAFAEFEEIGAIVVFTKPDLAGRSEIDRLSALYAALGYPVIVINPKTGEQIDVLRTAIARRRALLCGISGVGKSSIFRALGGEASVGEVSRFGMGRQTTTAARLYRIGEGFLIDSPGVNEFGLGKVTPQELTQGFREMPLPAQGCRFKDCTHLKEPDCGVKAAVASGRIAPSRYDSYRQMLGVPLP